MKLCIDTNAYSRMMTGDNVVLSAIESAEEIIVPTTIIGELMFGFLNGSRAVENEKILKQFLSQPGVHVQPTTQSIAERYGFVKSILKKQGTPIPENDIWIASATLETGARLLSYDRHFDSVSGLIRLAP